MEVREKILEIERKALEEIKPIFLEQVAQVINRKIENTDKFHIDPNTAQTWLEKEFPHEFKEGEHEFESTGWDYDYWLIYSELFIYGNGFHGGLQVFREQS